MGSDRARVSYDPSRKWRGLVAQQGRVTVEADWNEAASIDAERDRTATLDIVGPVGTPGGYAVTAVPAAGSQGSSAPGDLTVGAGTLYLGGERLDFDAPVDLASQPDWLDQATDTLWTAPAPAPVSPPVPVTSELVYLLAIEQEVSALEDPALSDVALGGPDTMQRLRILQHFVRWPTQAADCAAAWPEIEAAWQTIGLNLDATSMRLDSTAALQVGFVTEPAPPSLCEPAATSGYLGAENQLIRVQISSVDTAGVPTIVWGYDDATFLYQLTLAAPDGNGNLVLTLAEPPVDSYHYPLAGQAVELLGDAASLTPGSTGSAASSYYVASAAGTVSALTQGYDPSAMTVAIAGSLPPGYSGTQQLYLRVWQGSGPAPAGTAVELTALGAATGVTVTLTTTPAGGPFHPGDFWRFALRPSVPNLIYPARIGASAQPPDGPRVRSCPVAFVTWDQTPVVSSCVPPFESLVDLTGLHGGCCTLNIGPADLEGGASLQALLESHASTGPITACLAPGTYTLTEPLVLGTGFDDLTLEACGPGVVLQGPSSPGSEFVLGLIAVEGATSVTIRGLELSVPLVGFSPPAGSFASLSKANQPLLGTFSTELQVAIGISADGSAGLTVEDCTFQLPDPGQANSFGAGIFATGAMDDLKITGCTFQSVNPPTTVPFYDLTAGNQIEPPYQLSFGYLQVPGASAVSTDAPAQQLHDAAIEQGLFQGVTVPALVIAEIGTLRVAQNTVRSCYGGFWFVSLADPAQLLPFFDQLAIGSAELFEFAAVGGVTALLDRIFVIAGAIGQVLPVTPAEGESLEPGKIRPLDTAQVALARQTFSAIFTNSARSAGSPTAAAAGTPATEEVTEAALKAKASELSPGLGGFLANLGVSAPAAPPIPVADTGTSDVSVRLDLGDCQVDAVIADSYSGAGLLVLDLTAGTGSALLHDNRIRNRFPMGETVLVTGVTGQIDIVGFGEACVTGNIVANEVVPDEANLGILQGQVNYSMVLDAATTPYGAPAVAITGNVFIDPTKLPARQNIPAAAAAAGLGDWDLLNTVINYIAPPAVTGVSVAGTSPASGSVLGKTTVTVTGSGFTGVTGVNFGSTPGTGVTPTAGESDTSLTVISPAASSAGTVDVTVITPAGTSPAVPADQFTYLPVRRGPALPAVAEEAPPAAAEKTPTAAAEKTPTAAAEKASGAAATQAMPVVAVSSPLRLRVINSADAGRTFDLHPGELTIGREEGSAIQLRDGTVSHTHALLRVSGEDATIEDLRSTNRTKVNGVAIDRQTPFAAGDQIDVGDVKLAVEQTGQAGRLQARVRPGIRLGVLRVEQEIDLAENVRRGAVVVHRTVAREVRALQLTLGGVLSHLRFDRVEQGPGLADLLGADPAGGGRAELVTQATVGSDSREPGPAAPLDIDSVQGERYRRSPEPALPVLAHLSGLIVIHVDIAVHRNDVQARSPSGGLPPAFGGPVKFRGRVRVVLAPLRRPSQVGGKPAGVHREVRPPVVGDPAAGRDGRDVVPDGRVVVADHGADAGEDGDRRVVQSVEGISERGVAAPRELGGELRLEGGVERRVGRAAQVVGVARDGRGRRQRAGLRGRPLVLRAVVGGDRISTGLAQDLRRPAPGRLRRRDLSGWPAAQLRCDRGLDRAGGPLGLRVRRIKHEGLTCPASNAILNRVSQLVSERREAAAVARVEARGAKDDVASDRVRVRADGGG
jgi:pSer/pThr/pTyr-binding forkhead associated (FHA) protein